MLLIYVDDILITGNSNTIISKLGHDLNKSFLLDDLCSLHFSSGIEAFRDQTSLSLTRSKHTVDLPKKTKMEAAN